MKNTLVKALELSRASYLKGWHGATKPTPHQVLGLVDFQLRLFASLLACRIRDSNGSNCGLTRAPGFGAWILHIRQLRKLLGHTNLDIRLDFASGRLLQLLARSTNNSVENLDTVERLRNHLAHGGVMPSGATGQKLARYCEDLAAQIHKDMCRMFIGWTWERGASRHCRLPVETTVNAPDEKIYLWPLVGISEIGIEVFSRLTNVAATYHAPSSRRVLSTTRDEEVIAELLDRFLRTRPNDRIIANMASEVIRDLEGFSDQDSTPHSIDDEGKYTVSWERRTSDGIEPRTDTFRVGPDHLHQWRDGDAWRPYSAWLKKLATWPELARRIRQRMDRILRKRWELESDFLPPIASGESNLYIEPRAALETEDLNPKARATPQDFSTIRELIDSSLEANRGVTRIYFVVGEAGIGKTWSLERLAYERARKMEKEPGLEKPLFLYVSSTGNPLAKLDAVVQAAVGETQLLTTVAVKTLCRNGLMVVVIDGFDELLGGVTYKDALGSLRPWIEDLGGRGVLVVSARSSYYISQYRSSLKKNEGSSLSVHHEVFSLLRWDQAQREQYFAKCGVTGHSLSSLDESGRDLLRLPFFARVFAGEIHNLERHQNAIDLTELLIEHYLEREASKLTLDKSDEPLLTAVELREIFREAAEEMASTSERELEIETLRLIAEYAIQSELASRRGLMDRLTALCGLSAASSGNLRRFGFSHELYFDHFLGEAIYRHITANKDGGLKRASDLLQKVPLNHATVSVLRKDVQSIRRFVTSVAKHDSPPSHSLGVLWLTILESNEAPRSFDICGALFQHLDLSARVFDKCMIKRSAVERLTMDVSSEASLSMTESTLECLELTQQVRGQRRCTIQLDKPTLRSLEEAVDERQAGYSRSQIVEVLTSNGVACEALERELDPGPSEAVSAAEFFLSKIVRSPGPVVVSQATKTPDDPRLQWHSRYGKDIWIRFLDRLTNSAIGVFETFSAAGPPKLVLRFKVLPREVLARVATKEVHNFWSSLK